MTQAYLDGLNDAQRQAVLHGDGPLLVIAGAGTGKTKTLVCRVARLIDQGTDASRILLLTFSRRAAAEMISRVRHLLPAQQAAGIWGGTFHAVANRLLRIHGRAVDLTPDFTVMDQADAADLMHLIRSDLGLTGKDRRFPNKITLVKIYSHTVSAETALSEVVERYFPWCGEDVEAIGDIFEQYTQRKRRQRVVDYDDLLLFWRMLCHHPRAGKVVADRFDHLLVDEYQDTNTVQAQIVRGMCKTRENVVAVGDDAQSIYSFRAATIRNILDFPDVFPGARMVTLEKNYRSTQPILNASNAVIEQATERFTKNLYSDRVSQQKPMLVTCQDETEQCTHVCQAILDRREQGIPLHEQAVLFRASHHSAQLEIELARRNIPFHKYGGLRFIEAAHVKDLLALLRILENPYDELSWFRVLQLLDGIGPRTARRIMDQLLQSDDSAGPLMRMMISPPNVPAAAKELFAELRSTLAHCAGIAAGNRATPSTPTDVSNDERSASLERPLGGPSDAPSATPPLPAQVDCLRRFYEPLCKKTYDNAKVRLRDIEQLGHIAARYRSRRNLITDLTLDPPTSTSDLAGVPHLDEDYLILSTMHSAKGCEWTSVHVIHAADGMIPSDMATTDEAGIDEERRLLYVAMTRAKDHLTLHFPLRYYHTRYRRGDAHSYAQLTRFLTPAVRAHFEQRQSTIEDDESDGTPTDTAQLDDWLNQMWRR